MMPPASHICKIDDQHITQLMPEASHICSTRGHGRIYDPFGVAQQRNGIGFYKYAIPSGLAETVSQMTKIICNHEQKNIRMRYAP